MTKLQMWVLGGMQAPLPKAAINKNLYINQLVT